MRCVLLWSKSNRNKINNLSIWPYDMNIIIYIAMSSFVFFQRIKHENVNTCKTDARGRILIETRIAWSVEGALRGEGWGRRVGSGEGWGSGIGKANWHSFVRTCGCKLETLPIHIHGQTKLLHKCSKPEKAIPSKYMSILYHIWEVNYSPSQAHPSPEDDWTIM